MMDDIQHKHAAPALPAGNLPSLETSLELDAAVSPALAELVQNAREMGERHVQTHDTAHNIDATWNAISARLFAEADGNAQADSEEAADSETAQALTVALGEDDALRASPALAELCDLARAAADERVSSAAQPAASAAGEARLLAVLEESASSPAVAPKAATVTPLVANVRAPNNVVALAAASAARRKPYSNVRTAVFGALALAASAGGVYLARNHSQTTEGAQASGTQETRAAAESNAAAVVGDSAGTLAYSSPDAHLSVQEESSAANAASGGVGTPRDAKFTLHAADLLKLPQGDSVVGFTQLRQDGTAAVAWAADATNADVVARVVRAATPLVVSLENGALEAEVTPVPHGEAYAIDVGSTRIAVHGTHLRVERTGNHVVVDLVHGEIAIGAIPARFARTNGRTIVAPAHVEFDIKSPSELNITQTGVRSPLSIFEVTSAAGGVGPFGTPAAAQTSGSLGSLPGSSVTGARGIGFVAQAPRPTTQMRRSPEPSMPSGQLASSATATSSAPSVAIAAPAPLTRSRGQLQQAIAACIESRALQTAGDVGVTVHSELNLVLKPDGSVQSARFSPPLEPAAHECAAAEIYRSRFDGEATALKLPIHVAK